MRNIYNKYFEFIRIENEGYRRITVVIIVLLMIITPFFFELDLDDYLDHLFFQEDLEDTLFFYFIMLFPSPIIVGVTVKVFHWVTDGFNK